jgi:hypothetical protein
MDEWTRDEGAADSVLGTFREIDNRPALIWSLFCLLRLATGYSTWSWCLRAIVHCQRLRTETADLGICLVNAQALCA